MHTSSVSSPPIEALSEGRRSVIDLSIFMIHWTKSLAIMSIVLLYMAPTAPFTWGGIVITAISAAVALALYVKTRADHSLVPLWERIWFRVCGTLIPIFSAMYVLGVPG